MTHQKVPRRLSSASRKSEVMQSRKNSAEPPSKSKKKSSQKSLDELPPELRERKGGIMEKLEDEVIRLMQALEGGEEIREREQFEEQYSQQRIIELKAVILHT